MQQEKCLVLSGSDNFLSTVNNTKTDQTVSINCTRSMQKSTIWLHCLFEIEDVEDENYNCPNIF